MPRSPSVLCDTTANLAENNIVGYFVVPRAPHHQLRLLFGPFDSPPRPELEGEVQDQETNRVYEKRRVLTQDDVGVY